MLKQLKIHLSHEDLFIERYDRLMSQAMHLTEGDRQQAEDLLHDAFIQFTLLRPDLDAMVNPDGYLFITLRNLRLSQVRRAARGNRLKSLASYDSLEFGLRSSDLRNTIQIHDELRSICDYATDRKQTSKAGSVLILRFFHGYYPSETAQILRTRRNVVDKWLALARREAKLFLENPDGLVFMSKAASETTPGTASLQATMRAHSSTGDLFQELRTQIFRSVQGKCFSREELAALYAPDNHLTIDCAQLAHLVSCAICLDEVNKTLRLPTLAERNPFDVIGRDPRSKGGDGGKGGSSGGGGVGSTPAGTFARRSRRETRVTFEHRPEELQFSANGFVVGSLNIDSERSEQTISINLDEKISFVEVFSEQGMRLLLMNVEPPPDGPATQTLKVLLSDNRSLQLSLNFDGHWPTLHTLYYDPLLGAESGDVSETEVQRLETQVQSPKSNVQRPHDKGIRLWTKLRNRWTDFRHWTLDFGLFWRPATATVVLAALLVALLFFQRMHGPASLPSATDLLAQSALREDAIATRTDAVIHRTISVEERQLDCQLPIADCRLSTANAKLIALRKIEIWQSAEKGITARRLYDENGALIAGDWRRSDGVQTLYHHGSKPQLQLTPEERAGAPLTFDGVWQLEPSARSFLSLIANASQSSVEEGGNVYVITAESVDGSASSAVSRAVLILNRADLHPIEQTLVITQGNETREYRLIETNFEARAPSTVAPTVFEPEKELLGSDTGTRGRGDAETNISTPDTRHLTPNVASAALEVEVLRLLNQVGADMGEQVSVSRTPEGRLHVEALVETAQRKNEILGALASVRNNPAVRIEVNTVSEALKRKPQAAIAPTVVEEIGASTNTIPVEAELRGFFSKRGYEGERLDSQVRQFATRTVVRSREIMNHAWALRRLGQRFSAEELRNLDPDARTKWLALVRSHAAALSQATKSLRQELSPIFSGAGSGESGSEPEFKSDADLVRAVERLFALCAANDHAINSAFAISPDTEKAAAIKGSQFWRSLGEAQGLAAKINSATDSRR